MNYLTYKRKTSVKFLFIYTFAAIGASIAILAAITLIAYATLIITSHKQF